MRPGLSVRAAVQALRASGAVAEHKAAVTAVGADFARRYAGVPATPHSRAEPTVLYRTPDSEVPVLLGLYGCPDRVRDWLPGLPRPVNAQTAGTLLDKQIAPEWVNRPACAADVVRDDDVDLGALPVLRTTPRDAGPYITLGLILAGTPGRGRVALSAHRMLVLDRNRLAVWMVPGRALLEMHEAAVLRGERLPVTVNIGAPPAAVLASALTTKVLGERGDKLAVAGALAGSAIGLARAVGQDATALAESEIVLEGYFDDARADETRTGRVAGSLPEFLGYDGDARTGLPVLTVTAITRRRDPMYQSVIGPGREQSVILGLAGELTVALAGDDDWQDIHDLHYTAAGGGMLTLFVSVRQSSPRTGTRLKHIARRVFDGHPFVKLIVFTDSDVDVRSAEDVLWAITTRTNLSTDCTTYGGFRPLRMDPSQTPEWAEHRGSSEGARSFIDATVPYPLRKGTSRSFGATLDGGRR